jgi:hypothetical protein
MCRSIKKLRGEVVVDTQIREAALQFVRKISGYNKPSRINEEAFMEAVDEIAAVSRNLLDSLAATAAARSTRVAG